MNEKTIKEILDTRREFVLETEDEVGHYYIANPTSEDVRKADWNYAKVYNQAIMDKLPTQAQMMDILRERGIISEEYARQVERTRIDLAAALFRLENMSEGASDVDMETMALETARLRDELFKLNQKVHGPMGNTCENMAEDARSEYLTSRVVQRKDGTKVWPNFEAYLNEPNNQLVVKSRFEVMLWLQGLESDFLEKTPERQAMRGLAERRLNQAIEDAQREMDSQEATPETTQAAVETLVLPEEAPAPKKRGRKPNKA